MYRVARLSTTRMIIDTAKAVSPAAQYYEWDAHAEKFKLPLKDLVGLVAFSCTENDKFHDITFGIAIMTFDDPDLSRAIELADAFYTRLRAHSKFAMYNPTDGHPTGFEAICFDGTSASPMGRVDARPTLEIECSARVTRPGQWP